MSYETVVNAVTGQSGRSLVNLFDAYTRGAMNRTEFLEAGGQILATANARSSAAGEAIFRDYMERFTGEPYVLKATSTPWNPERLQKALNTIVTEEGIDTVMQLERLSRAEALKASRRAYDTAMGAEKRVKGWVRGLDSNACQLCTWWWREGRVWHPEHPMPAHQGCVCHKVPTVTTTSNFQTADQSLRSMQDDD